MRHGTRRVRRSQTMMPMSVLESSMPQRVVTGRLQQRPSTDTVGPDNPDRSGPLGKGVFSVIDPLNHFCPFERIFNFVHSTQSSSPPLSTHRGVLNEFLMTDEIDATTKHQKNDIHHDLSSSTTGKHLHVFVWRNSGSGWRYLVCATLGFSSPDFLELEFALNEQGVAPTSLQQPNVGLVPIRAGGPSRLLRLRQIQLPHGHTNRSRSELTAAP